MIQYASGTFVTSPFRDPSRNFFIRCNIRFHYLSRGLANNFVQIGSWSGRVIHMLENKFLLEYLRKKKLYLKQFAPLIFIKTSKMSLQAFKFNEIMHKTSLLINIVFIDIVPVRICVFASNYVTVYLWNI